MSNVYDFFLDPRLMTDVPYDFATGAAPAPNAGLLDPLPTYVDASGTTLPPPVGVGSNYVQNTGDLWAHPVQRPTLARAAANTSPGARWGGDVDLSSANAQQPQVQSATPPAPVPAQRQPTSDTQGLLPATQAQASDAGLLGRLRGTGKGGLFGMGGVDMSEWMPNMGMFQAGAALHGGKGFAGAADAMMKGATFDIANRNAAIKAQRDLMMRQIIASAPLLPDGTPDYRVVANQMARIGADPDTIAKMIDISRKGVPDLMTTDSYGRIVNVPGSLDAQRAKAAATAAPEVATDPLTGEKTLYDKFTGRPIGAGASAAPATIPGSGPSFDNVSSLRKEIGALKEVAKYSEALPSYRSMLKSASLNNSQADLDFIYGVAKIMDPESVVREGEQILIRNTQNLPDRVIAALNSIRGGERLSAEARANLLGVAQNRMTTMREEMDQRVAPFATRADRFKIRREDVLPNFEPLSERPPTAAEITKAWEQKDGKTVTDMRDGDIVRHPKTGVRAVLRGGVLVDTVTGKRVDPKTGKLID